MFNPRNQKPNDHIPILDPVTTSDYSYNLRNLPRNEVESVRFRVQESLNHVDYGDKSGVSSPPLWKNSHQISTNYRSNSTSSRALAIAKGQFELMEMVKNMPESCYELSLKDLVEQNRVLESDQEECLINKVEENFTSTTSPEQEVVQQRVKSIQRQESNSNKNKKGKMITSESFENQSLFLKMFFPISLESKKKNLKNSPKTTNTKVSPKPEGSVKSSKNVEKDWWKRRFSCSSESDSSRTGSSNSESTDRSGSSGSSGSRKSKYRKKKGLLSSCWSRSCFSKSKSAE
ncbi:uncharacterized protein LOC107801301 [Nicotiana tabacum]|uniref:Uncharacterized protein LOC107801301 n=2 Tax=Nicotiana TaxID=4085 RepID=A0A1S4AUB7_TOBAC|nr:PREDICTED: uncharacterized protein LOC104211119 [Nicotiana sylvestris]XP_016480093.1 PREDICTED: uncharacterized protein LOC107801301 [Nicotiana tabacum]